MTSNVTKQLMLFPVVFENLSSSPKIVLKISTTIHVLAIDIVNAREFWVAGDHHKNGVDEHGIGRGDLCCILKHALDLNATKTFNVSVNSSNKVEISTTDLSAFSILWSHGSNSLPADIMGFGSADTSTSSSGILEATYSARGWWAVDRAIAADTLANTPALKTISTSATGLTETTFYSEQRSLRTLSFQQIPEAYVIESQAAYAHDAFSFYWRTALGRGYGVRLYPDKTLRTQGQYEIYRCMTDDIPYTRENEFLRWVINLQMRRVTLQQNYSDLTHALDSGSLSVTRYLYMMDSAVTFTISAWVKTNAAMVIFERSNSGTASDIKFEIATSSDRLKLTITTGVAESATSTLSDSAWHHVLVSVDMSQSAQADRVSFQIDGVASATTITTTGIPSTNSGASAASDAIAINSSGKDMSHLALWREALTPTQSQVIYNSGIPSKLSAFSTVPSPAHHWKLNNAATDEIASNTLTGSPVYAENYPGYCGSFYTVDEYSFELNDNQNAAGGYVYFGVVPAWNGNDETKASFSCWVKDDTATHNDTGWIFGSWGATQAYGRWRLEQRTGSWRVNLPSNGTGQYSNDREWTYARATGAWYHLAAVFDGTLTGDANRLKLYVNGVSQTGSQLSGGVGDALYTETNNSSSTWLIGCRDNSGVFDTGFVDTQVYQPVWFYGTALSSANVTEIYNSGDPIAILGSSVAGAISAYWSADECATSFTTAPDVVSGNDGTCVRMISGDIKLESP